MKERKLNRCKEFDYSAEGFYFVTVCVKDRKRIFGEIINEKMILNKYGEIVKAQWLWLEKQYPYIFMDDFIVMPDHFHGILVIDASSVRTGRDPSLHDRDPSLHDRDPSLHDRDPSLHDRDLSLRYKIKSLSELMGAFKTTASKMIHQSGLPGFQWQRSFHDRVIRNGQELNNVSAYINFNPNQWWLNQEDKANNIGKY